MQITQDHSTQDSETEFQSKMLHLIDSGAGVVQVRTKEIMRAVVTLRKTALLDGAMYYEYDLANGWRKFTKDNFGDESEQGDNNLSVNDAFRDPLEKIRAKEVGQDHQNAHAYFVFVNIQDLVENNPIISQLLLTYCEFLPTCKVTVVLVTPDAPLPDNPASSTIMTVRLEPPGFNELSAILTTTLESYTDDLPTINDFTEDDMQRIVYTGTGMSALQFETFVATACVAAYGTEEKTLSAKDVEASVAAGKTDIVNSSDLLELYPSTSISDVGGMDILKGWIEKRKGCYSDEAKEFGVEPPKGIVLVGVPGTGKSLIAKAIAGQFGVPLVRFDFSRVFSSLVGASESRMRQALHMVETMAPCVLFCDELDKGLGGISNGGGGDSGISSRVLGSFLTWLQDCKKPVFTMVTANNISGLPPELMRRGRFDGIFSTGMPTDEERREVLRIHLAKRGRDIEEFPVEDVDSFVQASARYVPAEIEAAVKDGLTDAFSSGEEYGIHHSINALAVMVPMSHSYAAKIQEMEAWARDNATPVSSTASSRLRVSSEGTVVSSSQRAPRRSLPSKSRGGKLNG